jgi:hypothetical protein
MREIPSHGRCHAAFLLAFSASLKNFREVRDWIDAASSRASFLAAAGDIAGTAEILLRAGLATAGEQISLDLQLAKLSHRADRASLVAIARLFLLRFPPSWIPGVVVAGNVETSLIPSEDYDRLHWLGADLIPLIFEVNHALTRQSDETLRHEIGRAGELVVMSALCQAGFEPVHVALLSDSYGYDIDYIDGGSTNRLEVKSAVERTCGRIIVSRNEFDKALLYGSSWKVVQVIFSTKIILDKRVKAEDILKIRELDSNRLHALAPESSSTFSWIDSAEFIPHSTDWLVSNLEVGPDFEAVFSE